MFKKILSLALILGLIFSVNAYGADVWRKGTGEAIILGSESPSDLDAISNANIVDPLDRMLANYRRGMACIYSSATAVNVLAGEVMVSNSTGSIRKMLSTTSTTSVGWSDIDTGSEASSTQYYIFAVAADGDATSATFKISTSSSAPSGVTHYRKIGYFYNNSSGDITDVGNVPDGVGNKVMVEGTSDITTSSTSYVDMDDMEIHFVSNGRPVLVSFTAPIGWSYIPGAVRIYGRITIDGTEYGFSTHYISTNFYDYGPLCIERLEALSAGTHNIKVQWHVTNVTGSNTVAQPGASYGERVLTAQEI